MKVDWYYRALFSKFSVRYLKWRYDQSSGEFISTPLANVLLSIMKAEKTYLYSVQVGGCYIYQGEAKKKGEAVSLAMDAYFKWLLKGLIKEQSCTT